MRPARKGPENPFPFGPLAGRARPFNEAGPQGAGKLPVPVGPGCRRRSFNEAGPQGAGKRELRAGGQPAVPPFNEAGPQGAGKLRLSLTPLNELAAFNEAGPQGAGKREDEPAQEGDDSPSMRPARKGPENTGA